ncbi:ATP-binding protein [Marinobacterium mangrovicola]|uniref:C4-dicarboxylate transport sensor protein DctB n=1 Tax=Marinobacterium mangrovicola TaxID=1476959 RepID=A0A4R1GGN5_9GAMM|nr:ATP-binding protein [Marinobacterium mangrovicola]TCK06090.1 two-component system C4-dicarboxylate transport sensor histidine kinase DctB [Marinobacterium mangrovicola]
MAEKAGPSINSPKAFRPAILFLLLALFSLLLLETGVISRQEALEDLQQSAESHLDRYIISLQQKLSRYKDLPHLLSTHSDLRTAVVAEKGAPAIDNANRYLEQVNEIMGTTDAYLMNAEGLTVAASNWRKEDTFIGRNFSFRPYFQDAMAGNEGRYFALGTTSNRRGYYFSSPLRLEGKVVGAVVVKVDLHDVERHWSNPLIDILVTDSDGVIFISTRPEWKFRSLRALSQADLGRIVESQRYGDYELSALDVVKREPLAEGGELITLLDGREIRNEALDGVEPKKYVLRRKQVPGTGLYVSVLASLAPVGEAMWGALLLVGFSTAAITLLILFLLARRRIVRERALFQQREMLALEENEARVRAIIDNTHAGLVVLDSSGCIESINPTAETLFGQTLEGMRGHYFSQLLTQPDRVVCWRHILADTAEVPDLLNAEVTGLRADGGEIPLEITINRMALTDGRHFIVTLHDLTERKEQEDRLRAAQEALESRVEERTADLSRANDKLREEMEQHSQTQNELIQTAKLAVIGQMSAGINHELNQPLTAIRNYADNARAFLARDRLETVDSNLTEISGLTERMSRIIHPLKEFARKSSNSSELVSLQAVRDGAMSLMYGRFEKAGVAVYWPERLSEFYVLGDILRLEQVVVNLLANALQAMETSADKRIDVSIETHEKRLLLSVRDHGPGIAESDLQRVFEPFFTTKKSGQGLGLGLSISYRIVETLDGKLTAANHSEGGAVFTIDLPRGVRPELTVLPAEEHDDKR